MKTLSVIAWIAIFLMGAASVTAIFANYSLLIREIRTKFRERQPSNIPVVGGLFGALAIYAAARITAIDASIRAGSQQATPAWASYAWLPVILDPGCNFLIGFAVSAIGLTLTGQAYWCKKKDKETGGR